jgi:hypothetical protein
VISSRLAAILLMAAATALEPVAAMAQSQTLLGAPRQQSQDENTDSALQNRRNRRANEAQARPEAAAPTEAPQDPAKNKTDAQAALTAAGSSCQVTEATLLGVTNDTQSPMFEAACATGPGFIVVASTPPVTFDCAILATQAAGAPAADPAAASAQRTCQLPANQNTDSVFAGYARSAGVTCTVDDGAARGRRADGKVVYEIGCAGVDGYWVEEGANGWTKTTCLTLVAGGNTCNFTTADEQKATVQSFLAGTEGAPCVVSAYRLMGQNANGQYFEAKCNAGTGGGYVLSRKDDATVRVIPCAMAQPIGGGCTLTTQAEWEAEAAPAAPAQ